MVTRLQEELELVHPQEVVTVVPELELVEVMAVLDLNLVEVVEVLLRIVHNLEQGELVLPEELQ
jgi:hypothetical protein